MSWADPIVLGELLLEMVPVDNVGYWVNDDGHVVVVVRDAEFARDLIGQLAYLGSIYDEPQSE